MRWHRQFEFAMSKTAVPDMHAATERLQVCADYARIRIAFGGELLCALSGVTSTAYKVLHIHLGAC